MTAIRRAFPFLAAAAIAAAATALAVPALAAEPVPWGLGMQPSASPVKVMIQSLHDTLLVIITLITLFVLGLLAYVVWRFDAKKNPNPSRTSHNTTLEVAWTLIPALILIVIAFPSFRLIYYQDRAQEADMTVKVVARQWYWHYQYPDHDNLAFDSRMVPENELRPGQRRLLDVDHEMVVPAGKTIRVLVTSDDVIHSWFIPSLGVQKYGIAGRTIETWFRADQPGTYYGQCNQICGTLHAYMPAVVRVVPQAEFTTWLEQARRTHAALPGPVPAPARLAALADSAN